MDILGNFKLVLGSASPRRKLILEQAGIPFLQRTQAIDETYPKELAVEKVPEYLAKKKADVLIPTLNPDEILLTSDSVVIIDNKILGKPSSRIEARNMLTSLGGKEHKVISGVCLSYLARQECFSSTSTVLFGELNDEEIDHYLDNFKPFDKAGGYGIQEWIGHCKVMSITGSYLNIVGLPMAEVYQRLKKFVQTIDG